MSIVKTSPTAPTPLIINQPTIADKEFSSVVVDSKYLRLSSLLTYIEGSSWTTTYYSQVIGRDNDIQAQDINQSGVYQQYTEIKNLELKVSSPLSISQDVTTNRMNVTGTSTIYPFIIPNVGDMFCADVGDGREGVFRITNSDKKSILKESAYVIDYSLIYYSDADKVRRQDLISKSINSFYFVKESLYNGQNPLLIDSEYNALNTLSAYFGELTKNYFRWFYSNEYKSLLVPGQVLATYDHYITKCMLAIVTTRDAPEIQFIRRMNLDDDNYINQPQLYEVLVKRDKELLSNCTETIGKVETTAFSIDPMFEGIRYTGIKYIVYPDNPDTTLVSNQLSFPKPTNGLVLNSVVNRPKTIPLPVDFLKIVVGGNNLVTIKPVLIDAFYALSQSFYHNTPGSSLLEVLTSDYLDRQAISATTLVNLITGYKDWNPLERFYYIPILLILIRSVIKDI